MVKNEGHNKPHGAARHVPRLRFRATPRLQSWKHKNGGLQYGTYAGERTPKIVGPVVLRDRDEVDMDAFDAQWCLVNLPENFERAEAAAEEDA